MASGFDVSRLESLLESAKLLQSTLDRDLILKHLLRSVMGRLLARRGFLAVRNSQGQLKVELARGLPALASGAAYDEGAVRAGGAEHIFPIGSGDPPAGHLGIGGLATPLAAEESEFVQALLGMASSVVSNAEAHQLLDQRLQELRALLDLGRGLAATLDPDEVARLVGLTLAGRWAISKYAVIASRPPHPPTSRQKGLDLRPFEAAKEAVGKLDTTASDPASLEALNAPPGSLLIPIRTKDDLIGVIVCGPRPRGLGYREADLEFGAGLAAQASVAFENAWHFRDTLARQQLEKELELAASIQRDLFPKRLPQLAGLEIAARNRQAKQVGGDYFDILPFSAAAPDEPHLFCVADVSGKGISAALLMSTIQATLRSLLKRESSILEIAGVGNELIHATTPVNKYATAFLCGVDPRTGACRYVNCGHNAAVLLRANGEVEMLDGPGLALGLFARRTHAEQSFHLNPGDILAIYSDGVSEAQNGAEEEFEVERLTDCLKAHHTEPAAAIVDRIFDAIDSFAGDAPQFDDITLMIVKRNAGTTSVLGS